VKSSATILEEHRGALVLLVTLADERCMVISVGANGHASAVLADTGTPVIPLDLPVTPEEDEAFNAMQLHIPQPTRGIPM
jgi:hypothetical protein